MKIIRLETFAVRAQRTDPHLYWGKATWGTPHPADQSREKPAPNGSSDGEGTAPAQENELEATRAALWEVYPPLGRMRPVYSDTIDTTLVKLTADNGLVGWGEAKAPVAPEVAQAVVDQLFAKTLLGADPFDVELIWETLYASMRLRGHGAGFFLEALSGVDIALWDLMGQATGKPIHKLMGGAYRRRVPIYASGVPATRAAVGDPDWERMIHTAEELSRRGFRALKMGIGLGPQYDLASVKAVRDSVPHMKIFADAAGNYDVPTAIAVGRELEALGIGFLEAPLPYEYVDGYAEVARALAMPVANDVLVNRFQVLEYLKRGALDIVQPDVCRAGGLTELKRIAVLADSFGVAFTPHVSIGSAIHFAASLQVAAAVPNLFPMEFWCGDNPLGDALLVQPVLQPADGYLRVPMGPGLGIQIDERRLLPHVVQHNVHEI